MIFAWLNSHLATWVVKNNAVHFTPSPSAELGNSEHYHAVPSAHGSGSSIIQQTEDGHPGVMEAGRIDAAVDRDDIASEDGFDVRGEIDVKLKPVLPGDHDVDKGSEVQAGTGIGGMGERASEAPRFLDEE